MSAFDEERDDKNFATVILRAGDDFRNESLSKGINLNLEEVKEERDRRGRQDRLLQK